MNIKVEITSNELSHYKSLIKQDAGHRKLIKKLQTENAALKQGQTLPIDSVSKCNNCSEVDSETYCKKCYEEAWEINPC